MSLGMEILGALVGAAVGVAVGYGNMRITKRSMRKDAASAIMATNMIRMLINFAVLLVIFLLRNVSPLGFVGTLLGAAVGLSIGNIYFIVRLSREWARAAAAEQADGENESGGASSNEI